MIFNKKYAIESNYQNRVVRYYTSKYIDVMYYGVGWTDNYKNAKLLNYLKALAVKKMIISYRITDETEVNIVSEDELIIKDIIQ